MIFPSPLERPASYSSFPLYTVAEVESDLPRKEVHFEILSFRYEAVSLMIPASLIRVQGSGDFFVF